MPGPIEILKHEHRIIERALRAIAVICFKLEDGEKVQPDRLRKLLDFIRTFADSCHHAKEEAHLFPALRQRGIPQDGGPIGVMLYEHRIGRELVDKMGRAIEDYESGAPDAGQRFVQAARSYINLLAHHIQKEDNILFRMAEQVLDDEASESLVRAFKQAEAELGVGLHERYERIAAELEKEWTA